jgi:DNA-binding CsgD family transcriptional regulator
VPIFDDGLGFAGVVARKPPAPKANMMEEVREIAVATGPTDFVQRHFQAASELPPDQLHRQTRSGPFIVSELTEPEQLATWKRHVEYAEDAIGVMALDTDGFGVLLLAPVSKVQRVRRADRECLEMIAAHLAAGLRLRRALSESFGAPRDREASDLPLGADAVLEPRNFQVREAASGAQSSAMLTALREAAVRVDRARGRLRKEDPERALTSWRALVRGRWSMVDWFDTDDRRYVLALPNPPSVTDPRGLTERETQVASYAALGDKHKMIAYRLGIDRSTVTKSLRRAMRKLGVNTQAGLVEKLRGLAFDDLDSDA